MSAEDKILALITDSFGITAKRIQDELGMSRQFIHRIFAKLVANNSVIKIGYAPKTIYQILDQTLANESQQEYGNIHTDFLNTHFLCISEIGEMLYGAKGFGKWCVQRNLPFAETIDEFVSKKIATISTITNII